MLINPIAKGQYASKSYSRTFKLVGVQGTGALWFLPQFFFCFSEKKHQTLKEETLQRGPKFLNYLNIKTSAAAPICGALIFMFMFLFRYFEKITCYALLVFYSNFIFSNFNPATYLWISGLKFKPYIQRCSLSLCTEASSSPPFGGNPNAQSLHFKIVIL